MTNKEKTYFDWLDRFSDRREIKFLENPTHPLIAKASGFESFKIFSTRMRLRAQDVWGTGADWGSQTAFLKSTVECIERALVIQFGKNVAGSACHFTAKLALEAAERELFERDAFFSRCLLGWPMGSKVEPVENLIIKSESLRNSGINIEFYEIPTASPTLTATICIAFLKAKDVPPLSVGLAGHAGREQAQRRSLIEALTILNGMLNKQIKPMGQTELRTRLAASGLQPQDHARFGLNPAYVKEFAHSSFSQNISRQKQFARGERIKIESRKFDLEFSEFFGSGLHYASADSGSVQKPYWGYPDPSCISFERLLALQPKVKVSDIKWNRLHLFC
jgi:hypothetical protein